MLLSLEAYKEFLDMCENPAEPNEKLKVLMRGVEPFHLHSKLQNVIRIDAAEGPVSPERT